MRCTLPSHFFNRVLPLAINHITNLQFGMGSSVSRIHSRPYPLPLTGTSDSTTNPRFLLPVLPPEVLLIILNLAHQTTTLSDWRVVSKQFNDLIAPIFYHHVTLNARIVSCFHQTTPDRSAIQLRIANYVCKHTRHVSIDRKLHWPSVLKLLHLLENLQQLRYVTFTEIPAVYSLSEAHN